MRSAILTNPLTAPVESETGENWTSCREMGGLLDLREAEGANFNTGVQHLARLYAALYRN